MSATGGETGFESESFQSTVNPDRSPVGLTFAIIILVLTFVLTWSARHHDRRQARHDHELAYLDTPELDDHPRQQWRD